MEFSELFKSSPIVKFSPDSQYIATISQLKLCIRDAQSLQIKQVFTCKDIASKIEWSHDSKYILILQEKRNLVQICALDSERIFDINQGMAGAVNARFISVPSCQEPFVLVNADFQLRISVWRVTSAHEELSFVTHLKMPKFDERGLHVSCRSCVALLERRDAQDYVSIFHYSEGQFQLESHFTLATKNAVDLRWSPNGEYLVVWDSLLQYRLCVYHRNGELLKNYQAYENALGIKSIAFSPTGQFIAIGSYDNLVRIMDMTNESMHIVAEFPHDSLISQNVSAFREEPASDTNQHGVYQHTRYSLKRPPIQLRTSSIRFDQPNPQNGIGMLEFSPNGNYLLSRSDNIPTALFIWDLKSKFSLFSVLIQMNPITGAQFDPSDGHSRLCLVTSTDKMYMWSDEGCSCVSVPLETEFSVQSIQWSTDGSALALLDKRRAYMCCCYPVSQE